MFSELLLSNPLLPRAALIGLCGAAGLMLIYWYGTLGPMLIPAYGALCFALAVLVKRNPALPFAARFTAILLGFCIASAGVYALSVYSAAQERKERYPNPQDAPADGLSLGYHAVRVGLIIAVGAALSAIVSAKGL